MAIGKPLQGRRVLMLDVCPVAKAAKVPEGLKIETDPDRAARTRSTGPPRT